MSLSHVVTTYILPGSVSGRSCLFLGTCICPSETFPPPDRLNRFLPPVETKLTGFLWPQYVHIGWGFFYLWLYVSVIFHLYMLRHIDAQAAWRRVHSNKPETTYTLPSIKLRLCYIANCLKTCDIVISQRFFFRFSCIKILTRLKGQLDLNSAFKNINLS